MLLKPTRALEVGLKMGKSLPCIASHLATSLIKRHLAGTGWIFFFAKPITVFNLADFHIGFLANAVLIHIL